MTADELLHKFDVFRNSDVRTDRGQPMPFGLFRRFWYASGINCFSAAVPACPDPTLPGKHYKRTMWAPVLNQRAIVLLIILILNKTMKNSSLIMAIDIR